MTQPRKVVAVTGAAGYVGSRLLKHLETEPGRGNIVAFDTKPLAEPIHNIVTYRRDVSEHIHDELADQRVNTLVHLAFNGRRGVNRREVVAIRRQNLDTLRAVLQSCVRAQVEHLVFVSSHTVYGARRENATPVTEEAELRPPIEFPYGYDKYLSERMLQEFLHAQPEMKVTILRPCVVLGPGADTYATRALFRPWLLGVFDYNPPLQFVYEDDLARVVTTIIRSGTPGVFNVAGDGVVYFRELTKMIKSHVINLPPVLAYPLAQLTWELKMQRDTTARGMDLVRWPILLSTGKLHQATGYRFWHTSLEAVTAFANANYLYREPAPEGRHGFR